MSAPPTMVLLYSFMINYSLLLPSFIYMPLSSLIRRNQTKIAETYSSQGKRSVGRRAPSSGNLKKMGKKRPWELLNIAILIREQGENLKNKLRLFKKVRKFRRHSLLQHYNYNLMAEYEFSPDSSPDFRRKRAKGYLCPLLLCAVPCNGGVEDDDESALVSENLAIVVTEKVAEDAPETDDEREVSTDGTDSIDRKADEFIARFYREMQLQRQVSEMQFTEMLNRGCS